MWEPLVTGVKWKNPPLFTFRMSRARLVTHVGPPHAVDVDSNGVGLVDAWAFRMPCGIEVVVWILHMATDASWRTITDPAEEANIEVNANTRDVDHILSHLSFVDCPVSMWQPTLQAAPRDWVLWRQDDHGTRYAIGSYTSQCEAAAQAEMFEERGHKQMYWVERSG